MANVSIEHIEQLLELLSKKTKAPVDVRGFGEMAEKIGGKIKQKYLYENLFLAKEKAKEKNIKSLSLQPSKLDALAQYLKYDSFRLLELRLTEPINKILDGCLGTYYSYVRMSNEKGMLLRSPVRIFEEGTEVIFELKGEKWNYEGTLRLSEGTLMVLMQSESGKEFHHVYRIGKRESPDVLRGMFSGVSTNFDPIGGRVVLVRRKEKFTDLKIAQLEISDLQVSESLVDRRLAEYFSLFQDNNLRIQGTSYFSIDDLGICK